MAIIQVSSQTGGRPMIMFSGNVSLTWQHSIRCMPLKKKIQVNPCWSAPQLKHWRILLEQRFTIHMPLVVATSTFGLGENARVLLNSVIYIMLPTTSPYCQKCTNTNNLSRRAHAKLQCLNKLAAIMLIQLWIENLTRMKSDEYGEVSSDSRNKISYFMMKVKVM